MGYIQYLGMKRDSELLELIDALPSLAELTLAFCAGKTGSRCYVSERMGCTVSLVNMCFPCY